MHLIENDRLRIAAREMGAELISLFDKKTNIQHLWQADPMIWGWHAPTLFPVVGRCLNDKILIDGKPYNMAKHGFARKSVFSLTHQSTEALKFTLSSSESTLSIYPYHFDFHISYELK